MGKELTAAMRHKGKLQAQQLIPEINRLHKEVLSYQRAALVRAKDTGELILEAKEMCAHGFFEKFVEEHFDGSLQTARTYMKVAEHWDEIVEVMGTEAYQATISQGMKVIEARLKETRKITDAKHSPEPEKEPVDGTDDCPRGGSHIYDSTGCCKKCADQLPGHEAADGAEVEPGGEPGELEEAAGDPGEPDRGDEANDPVGGQRDRARTLREKAVKLTEQLMQVVDELHAVEPMEDVEGLRDCFRVAYKSLRGK